MRFFERQQAARAQSERLLLLFALTRLALLVAVNAALALTWRLVARGGVQHLLLLDAQPAVRWFATHPPLAERIRRIDGGPTLAMPADDLLPKRPDAILKFAFCISKCQMC